MSQALERILLHHVEGSRAGQVDSFTQPVVTVGRAPDCHLVFTEEKGVSGRHCEIRQGNGQFELVDNNSTNGTFVGDERVTAQVLKSGDQIRFGWMGPVVKVEFEEAVRAVHAGHPDDAQSTVVVSARRIAAAAEALGEGAAPAPKAPAITMPPPSRTPAPPPTPARAPAPPPVAAAAPPAAAPRPAPAAAPAAPPRPAAPPMAAAPASAAPGGSWSASRWIVAIAVVVFVGVALAVGVWFLMR
jgi:predicted component of type VI protein secretion system